MICALCLNPSINFRAAGAPVSFLWLPSRQASAGLAAPAHHRLLWLGEELAIFICLSLPSSLLNEFRHTEDTPSVEKEKQVLALGSLERGVFTFPWSRHTVGMKSPLQSPS